MRPPLDVPCEVMCGCGPTSIEEPSSTDSNAGTSYLLSGVERQNCEYVSADCEHRDAELVIVDQIDSALSSSVHSGVVAEIYGHQCDNFCSALRDKDYTPINSILNGSAGGLDNGLDATGSVDDLRQVSLGCESDACAQTNVHKKRMSVAARRAEKVRPDKLENDVETEVDRRMALRGYEAFYRIAPGSATLMQVIKSSAGVAGWCQFAHVMDAVSVDAKADEALLRRQLAQQKFLEDLCVVDEIVQQRSAKQVRFSDPASRGLHIFEVHDPIVDGDSAILSNEWEDVEFEVALDSGSQDHVCAAEDCPGYRTESSPGSNRGQCFIVGDGNRLPNMGQSALNLAPMDDSTVELKSCFQIARVTRPLMSVGKICDNGMKVEFNDKQAVVRDRDGAQVCVFERQPGGLYLAKFRLKSPGSGFARQG